MRSLFSSRTDAALERIAAALERLVEAAAPQPKPVEPGGSIEYVDDEELEQLDRRRHEKWFGLVAEGDEAEDS